ncbi:hypothetical protein T190611E02C_60066 [Tenacibaculum sp. 190524A05c]|uniref:hypothetical protein n=1 Tax=Tenacibaculum platacis TaxID=3137852 RepID=UPI0031FB684C
MKIKNRVNDNDVDNTLESKGFDANGGEIFYYQGQPFNGFIESYYENGNLRDEVEYSEGSIGGVIREYYENGVTKSEYFQYFNKYKGISREWNEDGKLISKFDWDKKENI